jgi:hypothetical protein
MGLRLTQKDAPLGRGANLEDARYLGSHGTQAQFLPPGPRSHCDPAIPPVPDTLLSLSTRAASRFQLTQEYRGAEFSQLLIKCLRLPISSQKTQVNG